MDIRKFNKLFIKHYKPTSKGKWKKANEHLFSNGLCWYWAYVFVCVYGGEFVNMSGQHMMVKLDGKFYDGNNPGGLDSCPTDFQGHYGIDPWIYKSIEEGKEHLYFSDEICAVYEDVAEKIIKELYL